MISFRIPTPNVQQAPYLTQGTLPGFKAVVERAIRVHVLEKLLGSQMEPQLAVDVRNLCCEVYRQIQQDWRHTDEVLKLEFRLEMSSPAHLVMTASGAYGEAWGLAESDYEMAKANRWEWSPPTLPETLADKFHGLPKFSPPKTPKKLPWGGWPLGDPHDE